MARAKRATKKKAPERQVRKGQSKPGSADAWIDELYPNNEWRLMTPKQIHGAMANYAKKRGWKKFPSYSAVAAALSKRPTPTDPLSCPGIDGGEY